MNENSKVIFVKECEDIDDNFVDIFGVKMENENINKQEIFDRFLTYRRRMARLSAVQAIYLYDIKKQTTVGNDSLFFKTDNKDVEIENLCNDIIEFYKNYFFVTQEYEWNKKNKKIDENFMLDIVLMASNNIEYIDRIIQNHLSKNWTTDKLNFILRAIIRCAIAEILINNKIEKPVLCSEYTNIASNFFNGKEIGFINGIVDKIYNSIIGNL